MKVSPHYAHIVFGALLSAIMVTIVSGCVIVINQGVPDDFFWRWLKSFATTWPIAFPTVLVVAPLVQRVVKWLTT